METNDNLSAESMTVEQAIAEIPILAAQIQDREQKDRNIARMGSLLATCARENRPPTIEEIKQIGRELLRKPHLVAQPVHCALKGD